MYWQVNAKAVDRALANGTLNDKKHTPEEIADLKCSGVWHDRYSKYLNNDTYMPDDIQDGAKEWAKEYFEQV